jgi:hypothetical protein
MVLETLQAVSVSPKFHLEQTCDHNRFELQKRP